MVSGVSMAMSNLGKAWGYTKRVGEVVPELIFGSASESIGETLRKTNGSLFTKAQAGWHALEKAGAGNFFENFIKNFKSFIPDIKNSIKISASKANIANQSKFLGGVKGLFKGIGKKMPFIGALSMRICPATSELIAMSYKVESAIFSFGAIAKIASISSGVT